MIRRATLQDLPYIIELGGALTREGHWSFTSINFKAAMDRLTRAVRSRTEYIAVAEHNARIVGFIILIAQPLWWNPSQWQVIDDIIWCERAGMGRQLMKAGIAWAASLPVDVREIIVSLNSGINTEGASKVLRSVGLAERGVTLSVPIMKRRGHVRWVA